MTTRFPINRGFFELDAPIFGDAPTVPTIQAVGKAERKQSPVSGTIAVTIVGKGTTREEAWSEFQEGLVALRDALGSDGEMGNAIPVESEQEVTKMLRSVLEFTVSSPVEVVFVPNRFVEVIDALIKCGLPVKTPRFEFGEEAEVTPEMLTEAAADARTNAAAVTAGVGARLGRLVSIRIGVPQLRHVWRTTADILPAYSQTFALRNVSSDAFSFDEDKLKTYDTEVQVTVVYEVIDGAESGTDE